MEPGSKVVCKSGGPEWTVIRLCSNLLYAALVFEQRTPVAHGHGRGFFRWEVCSPPIPISFPTYETTLMDILGPIFPERGICRMIQQFMIGFPYQQKVVVYDFRGHKENAIIQDISTCGDLLVTFPTFPHCYDEWIFSDNLYHSITL